MGRCATLHCSVTYRQKDRGTRRERGMKSLMRLDSLKPSLCQLHLPGSPRRTQSTGDSTLSSVLKDGGALTGICCFVVEIVLVALVFVCGHAFFKIRIMLLNFDSWLDDLSGFMLRFVMTLFNLADAFNMSDLRKRYNKCAFLTART